MSNLMQNRHSARSFTPQEVTDEVLTTIVKEAQLAPSWENTQPTHVYAANGQLAQIIRKEHQEKALAGQPSHADFRPSKEQNFNSAALTNMVKFSSQLDALGETGKREFLSLNQALFNAPAIVYLTVPKNATPYEHYDAGAFGYGILLAAERQGLRGIPAYEFVRYAAEIRAHFAIPEDEEILMGIGLGYAADDQVNAFNPGRADVTRVLTLKSND